MIGRQTSDERGDVATVDRVSPIGRDLGERQQDEGAVGEPGMR